MYNELLHETIAELRGETIQKPPDVDVNIKADSFFPEAYIPDAGERVLFYRRLSETLTADDVAAIVEEITDRFGRPSGPAANIVDTAYIRHYASSAGISEVVCAGTEAVLLVPETVEVTRDVVEKMVAKSPVKLTFSFNKGMRVSFPVNSDMVSPLEKIKKVLQAVVT
jgi:transcription-repair coupling factor (superfamily II helicase)